VVAPDFERERAWERPNGLLGRRRGICLRDYTIADVPRTKTCRSGGCGTGAVTGLDGRVVERSPSLRYKGGENEY